MKTNILTIIIILLLIYYAAYLHLMKVEIQRLTDESNKTNNWGKGLTCSKSHRENAEIIYRNKKRLGDYDNRVYYVSSNSFPVFRGIALPHLGIFIKEEYKNDKILVDHETIHLNQIKRMGFLLYLIRYTFQLIFIGYDTMPMELESRQTDESLWNYRERNWK